MSTPGVAWLERGRQHQLHARPIDAMLCFRRAAQDAPRAAEPRFRLGEVLWHLGIFDDALTCWREAAARAPDDPLVQTRLAEALLQSGDRDGARAVAAQSLARAPDNPRARVIVSIVAIVDADATVSAAADTIVEWVTGNPALLEDTAIAGALAQALDAADDRRAPILDAIALLPPSPARVTAMPGTLVAQVVERCAAASLPSNWRPGWRQRVSGAGRRAIVKQCAGLRSRSVDR